MPPCFLRREGCDEDPDGSGGGSELGGVGGEEMGVSIYCISKSAFNKRKNIIMGMARWLMGQSP